MANDEGIYVLVCPSPTDKEATEYRVVYLESANNFTWDVSTSGYPEVDVPTAVKTRFTKVPVFTDKMDADEEAFRLADNYYITKPPVYHIYISTPFVEWERPSYAEKHKN